MLTVQKPQFFKVFDCSTGHINEQDNNLLGMDYHPSTPYSLGNQPRIQNPLSAQQTDYGFLVHTAPCLEPDTLEKDMRDFGYTQELFNLIEYAFEHECRYLGLDRDGPLYNDLPQFEW